MAIALLLGAVLLPAQPGLPQTGSERFYPGLGSYHRSITTKSKLAQRYFDQGIAFTFGFNHDEAIKSFRAAAKADPECPMAYWGIANAYGPNINFPMVTPDHAAGAWEALQKAKALAGKASPVERALIAAQAMRYANPQPEDRSPLDKAYADAMRVVRKANPKDPDVGALFAESLMDLRPWALWSLDGKPSDVTPEVLATLRSVVKLSPKHPFGLHLTIHAIEASPNPERAMFAADRLRSLQPGLGHMVHMPSHIDIRTGRWKDAEVANTKAIAADTAYRKAAGKIGFYRGYITHNYHMLTFAAMMRGQGDLAIKTMDEGVAIIPKDWAKQYAPFVDGFFAMPISVRVRFGRWEDVLKQPDLPEYFPISRAMRRGARAIAYAATGRIPQAWQEQVEFEKLRKALPADAAYGNNSGAQLLEIESHLVSGELLLGEKYYVAAADELRRAVAVEDQTHYDEPPDWIQPTRHTLGAILVEAGRYKDAIPVYERDLKEHPDNVWALKGLTLAYRGLGNEKLAGQYEARFRAAAKDADLSISSSCLCVPGKG